MSFYNRTRGCPVAPGVIRARYFWQRMKGLLGRDPEKGNDGLWIVPCSVIHTVGMRRDLDILFLDRSMTVVKIVPSVKPGRWAVWDPGAYSVVEFFSGFWDTSQIAVHERLEWIND